MSIITYIVCLTINGLSQFAAPKGIKEVSDDFRLWVTPSPPTFAIWGLIYTLVTVVLYLACTRNTWNRSSHVNFWMVNMLNTLWLVIWGQGTK